MVNYAAPGARTVAEIEAEMRAQAQRARELKMQQERERQQQLLQQQLQQQQIHQQQLQQQQLLLQQQQLQQHQQQQLKPPRMRSQSPSVHRNVHVSSPQAGYQASSLALENYRQQQQGSLQDFNGMRVQETQRGYARDPTYGVLESHNRTHTPVDPIEFMLQKTAERERGIPQSQSHSRAPSQQYQQQRIDLELQEQERRLRLDLAQGNVDDIQANLRRQIIADQQRQAQLASPGMFDQRRDSPLDQLHNQYRVVMANELANKTRASDSLATVFGGTNPAEMTQMQLQMQQRLLAQLAQQEFTQNISGINGVNGQNGGSAVSEAQREQLRQEAMRKIMEAERQEGKRRRKAHKIAHMVSLTPFSWSIN